MVELLVIPGCPHAAPARDALRQAGQIAGQPELAVTVIDSTEQAQRRGFAGSPTFLIDGVDPFAVADAPVGLACRLYLTADGPAGVPDAAMLLTALLRV